MALRVIVFVAGLILVGWTLFSAVGTVVLPRAVQGSLARTVFRAVRAVFGLLAKGRAFETRDRIMAFFAPVGLLAMAATWLVLITAGYMAMFWGLEERSWSDAFYLSGSSLFTLGFATVEGNWQRLLEFTEAALGLGLVALLITYLPSIYGGFNRRETRVALLEVRAGSPPFVAEFLVRFHRIGWLGQISDEWAKWEEWFADIEETHTSYPALAFFRSPQPDRHWVTAAGTVLDTAAMSLAVVDLPPHPQAAVTIRAGFISLRRIADFFGIDYDPDPAPDDPISIIRDEFDEVCASLEEAGIPLRPDRDQAWRDFAGWRVNYDKPLLDLAQVTMAPYAPWTSDRSAPDHTEVRLRQWGVRRFTRDRDSL